MMILLNCYTQYAIKLVKLSSDHRTGKCQFSFQSQRRASIGLHQIRNLCLLRLWYATDQNWISCLISSTAPEVYAIDLPQVFREFCDDCPLIFFRLSTIFPLIEILPLLPHLTKFIVSDCLYIVPETCQDFPKAYISLIDKFGHKSKCCGPLSLIIKTCSLSYPNFPNYKKPGVSHSLIFQTMKKLESPIC